MVVISHFKLYPALFPLKWLICIPNISAVRGNVVFETLHDFYRTAIVFFRNGKTEYPLSRFPMAILSSEMRFSSPRLAFFTAEKRSRLSRGHFSWLKNGISSVADISHG